MDVTKQKWEITRIGEPDPSNANCGFHGISIENGVSMIDVWFSNNHQIKTKGDALKVAKLIECAPELLEALHDLITAVDSNKVILAEEIENAKKVIEKATKVDCDGR